MSDTKTPDPNRSDACKRAWETIRRNRALKAAGLPVPASAAKPKAVEKDYSSLISGWLSIPTPQPAEILPAIAPPAPVLDVPPEIEAAPKRRGRPKKAAKAAPVSTSSKNRSSKARAAARVRRAA